LVAAYAEE